jgi:predicted anti-sigma-YlaC factor YlaD
MPTLFRPSDCAQAREAASARLDGELAELDAARLDAHLDACNDCRALAAGLEAAATLMRGAATEAPARSLILLPRRSAPRSLHLRTAVAAAAILAATSFSVGLAVRHHPAPAGVTVTAGAARPLSRTFFSADELALLPVSGPLSASHMIRLGQNVPV